MTVSQPDAMQGRLLNLDLSSNICIELLFIELVMVL